MYYKGVGVSQNFTTAATWFERAADKGHVSSSYNLGYLFYKGKGVAQDYARAYMWYALAAARATGNHQARARTNRDTLAKRMTPQQIAEIFEQTTVMLVYANQNFLQQ